MLDCPMKKRMFLRRATKAYSEQCIHAKGIIPFVFQEHAEPEPPEAQSRSCSFLFQEHTNFKKDSVSVVFGHVPM